MLQPDPIPNRTAPPPPRPVGRARGTTVTPKLPDFTEDPFRDYRYEDPFDIADPFAEDDDTTNANNKNKNNNSSSSSSNQGKIITTPTTNEVKKLDPFGFETTTTTTASGGYAFVDKDSFTKGFDSFESDFSKTFPSPKGKRADKLGNFLTDTKFNSSTTTRPVGKPINFDDAFTPLKNEKSKDRDITQAFKDMFTINHNTKAAKNNNSNAAWNGRGGNKDSNSMLSEKEQLAWASKQSLRAEEERCRRKAQEDADLALALELSRHDNSSTT